MTDALEDTLHGLDAQIERLRKRIWMIQHGLIVVEDREGELDRLQAEFETLGTRFVEAYREWSRQHAEE